ARKIKIPKSYSKVDNILINGMGGSGLGGHIIKSVFTEKIKVPFEVINSYTLPGYVNSHTLYIISSYSGTTEEPLNTFNEARRRGAKILVISSGGTLGRWAKKYKLPGYVFNPRFNPSNQPRMGLGYSVAGQLAMLKKCGHVNISDNEFKKVINVIVSLHKQFGTGVTAPRNKAKQLALKLKNRIPIIIAAEHLSGNAHAMANQLHENSKTFTPYYLISELNHHLMEGMQFPPSNVRSLMWVFIESPLYLQKIQKRFKITKRVLDKYKVSYLNYSVRQKARLAQVFEVLVFGSYVNYYLAILGNVNPSLIPYVDYFKKELKK
ncbi:SIS domain-containing protein, partial [Patescibacteria group bacterium]|nr:SIS domain-containing protein [Patescibacteria group bacterium]